MFNFTTFGLNQGISEPSTEELGGKGAGLVWMDQQGVSVPPGFVIPISVWAAYDKAPAKTMKEIGKSLSYHLALLEAHFGYKPLLSVRSGSRVSCPGMMDTILNVGLDGQTNLYWSTKLGSACFQNSYHRLVTMYGSVVKGINREELESGNLESALQCYRTHTKDYFPTATEQLLGSIEAVFKSWDNERALIYRKQHSIPREWGTAVTVQAMVFGNLNDQSATGVLFTRNPDTGENKVTGEFLINAQGEDVVAGIKTPMKMVEMAIWNPPVFDELLNTVTKLEKARKDVQDVEFTIQDGKLYLLQTRNAKRTPQAAVRIAVDMFNEGVYTAKEVVTRVSPRQLDLAQMSQIDPSFTTEPDLTGIAACSGVVSGKPVFTAQAAIDCTEPCILITKETTPDDIGGMLASVGVLTMEGGLTSHAAVVARGENKPCITGIGSSTDVFKDVKVVSMDGSTGKIWFGAIPILTGASNQYVAHFQNLLVSAVGAVPVITSAPEEQIPAALLTLGCQMLNPLEATALILKCRSQVGKLYVDLSIHPGAEEEFFRMCAGFDAPQTITNSLILGLEHGVPLLNLTIIGDVKIPESSPLAHLKTCTDLNDLIMAEGEVVSSVEDSPATQWVMKKKIEDGLKLVSIGAVVPGAVSIVSPQQVLGYMAKGA